MDKTRPTIAHGGSLMVCWLAEWSNVSFVYRALAYDATSKGHHPSPPALKVLPSSSIYEGFSLVVPLAVISYL